MFPKCDGVECYGLAEPSAVAGEMATEVQSVMMESLKCCAFILAVDSSNDTSSQLSIMATYYVEKCGWVESKLLWQADTSIRGYQVKNWRPVALHAFIFCCRDFVRCSVVLFSLPSISCSIVLQFSFNEVQRTHIPAAFITIKTMQKNCLAVKSPNSKLRICMHPVFAGKQHKT